MRDLSKYILPENEVVKCRREVQSPKGKYRLVIQAYTTGKGSWNYTRGTVYVGDAELVAFNANYSSFTHSFVEDHPNGHDYLICHENYQGQTVCELDTGRVRRFLPEEAAKGFGFCWAGHEFHPQTQLLVVNGCYWACPYEDRTYDFSNPMEGWPEVSFPQGADSGSVTLLDDGRALITQDHRVWIGQPGGEHRYREYSKDYDDLDISDDDCDNDANWETVKDAQTWYVRDGMKWVEATAWVSAEEVKIREVQAAREKAEAERWAKFKATDELFLKFVELSAKHQKDLKPTEGMWRSWSKKEESWEKTLYHEEGKISVRLSCGTETAPIRVTKWVYGVGDKEQGTFPRTVEGMEEAFQKVLQCRPILDKVASFVGKIIDG